MTSRHGASQKLKQFHSIQLFCRRTSNYQAMMLSNRAYHAVVILFFLHPELPDKLPQTKDALHAGWRKAQSSVGFRVALEEAPPLQGLSPLPTQGLVCPRPEAAAAAAPEAMDEPATRIRPQVGPQPAQALAGLDARQGRTLVETSKPGKPRVDISMKPRTMKLSRLPSPVVGNAPASIPGTLILAIFCTFSCT
jgi:hypothetical protein